MATAIPFYGSEGLHVEIYDRLHEQTLRGSTVEGDAEWFAARAREWGGPVLEGASGTGRVAWAMARAGVEVVGFDLSPAMLGAAEAKRAGMPPEVAARVSFLPGDLRDFDLGRTFPLAVVPFRAFQVLLTPEDQLASLRRFREHLEPGGRLVLDVFDPRYEYLYPDAGPVRAPWDVVHPVRGTRVEVSMGLREVAQVDQTFREEWVFREFDAAGEVVAEEREVLHLRWTFRPEMGHLFARTGFAVEAEYSDFRGSPPAYGGEQLWVVRRTG